MKENPKKLEFGETIENMGRPWFWHVEDHVRAVEGLILSDDIEMAFKLMDMVPAWYRKPENYPKELTEIKERLYKRLYTQFEYSDDPDERGYTLESVRQQIASGYMFPRLDVIDQEIEKLNNQHVLTGNIPWLFEISPSHGNLPIALMDKGRRFQFFGRNMNHLATARFKEWLKDGVWTEKPVGIQQKWLVCYEVLEHSWDVQDIVRSAYKEGHAWDMIFLSVPNGTLGHGLPSYDRRLGHIRTFDAREFLAFADKAWPGYSWTVYESVSIVLVGKKL